MSSTVRTEPVRLGAAVEDYGFSKYIEMTMLALIELGHPFECEMDDCCFDDRKFELEPKPRRPSIDHQLPTLRGGTNHPRNLRFAHARCNFGASTRGKPSHKRGIPLTAEARANISAGLRRRFDGAPKREGLGPWPKQTPEHVAKRMASMKETIHARRGA